jgi:hypothetical protein
MIDAELLLFLVLLFALLPAAGFLNRVRQPIAVPCGKLADRRLLPELSNRSR